RFPGRRCPRAGLDLGLRDRGGRRIDVARLGGGAVQRELIDVGARQRGGRRGIAAVLRVDLGQRLRDRKSTGGTRGATGSDVLRVIAGSQLAIVVVFVVIGVGDHGVLFVTAPMSRPARGPSTDTL